MRRAAAAVSAFVLLAASCGGTAAPSASPAPPAPTVAASAARPPTKIVVTYGSVAADVLPTYVALERGIFLQNGLDVDLQLISSSTAAVAALVSRKADLVQAGGSEALSSAAGGADVVVTAITSPVYSYLLEAAPEIKTPADLRGKKVGISTAGSSSDVAVRVALRKIGLEPDKDVTVVAVGGVPQRVAALQGGAIQATVANPPETTTVERAGFHPLLDLAGLKLPATNQTTITRRDVIASQPEVVQAFVDSLVESIAFMKKDKQFTVGVLEKYFKSTDDAAMTATVDFYVKEVFPAIPYPRADLFGDAIAVLSSKNPKVKDLDVNKILDPTFAQKAADQGLDHR